jgi:regulator of replication initiation timing
MGVSAAAHFDMSSDFSSMSKTVGSKSSSITTIMLPKIKVSIDLDLFAVNPKFVNAMREFARARPTKPGSNPSPADLEAFLALLQKWGVIFPRSAVLGAKLYSTSDKSSSNTKDTSSESSKMAAGGSMSYDGAGASAAASVGHAQGNSNNRLDSEIQDAAKKGFSVLGGDESLYNGKSDIREWRTSINAGWKFWQVIEVGDVAPTTDFLPPDLVDAVKPYMNDLLERTKRMKQQINDKLERDVAFQMENSKRAKAMAEAEAAKRNAVMNEERYLKVSESLLKQTRITCNIGKVNIKQAVVSNFASGQVV